jgi:hypothetical protein
MRWFLGKQEIIQVEIDSHPTGYTLVERTNRSTNEWANLLLTKAGGTTSFELGWNGQRLSNGRGTIDLVAHAPNIYQWALDTLTQAERKAAHDQ